MDCLPTTRLRSRLEDSSSFDARLVRQRHKALPETMHSRALGSMLSCICLIWIPASSLESPGIEAAPVLFVLGPPLLVDVCFCLFRSYLRKPRWCWNVFVLSQQ